MILYTSINIVTRAEQVKAAQLVGHAERVWKEHFAADIYGGISQEARRRTRSFKVADARMSKSQNSEACMRSLRDRSPRGLLSTR